MGDLNPQYAPARYHLAQAYERQSERELALAAYEQFLEAWKDADRSLPEIKIATDRLMARS